MNRMSGKWNVWTVLIVALAAIGLVYGLLRNPLSFIIPVVVLGGIFLLYKYPPAFLQGARGSQARTQVKPGRASQTRSKTTKPRSKPVPFRVIEGGKDDDDLPKYH
jgi:hypothetical protein